MTHNNQHKQDKLCMDSTGYKSRKQDYERKNIGDEIRCGRNSLWIFWF